MGFETFDAKLSSALSWIVVGSFSRKVHIMKMEALECGRGVSGRRVLFAIDQRFKLTGADGALFGMEHLLAIVMRGDNFEQFVSDWDTVITGTKTKREDQALEAIFMRQLRLCRQMQDDARDCEWLSGDDSPIRSATAPPSGRLSADACKCTMTKSQSSSQFHAGSTKGRKEWWERRRRR